MTSSMHVKPFPGPDSVHLSEVAIDWMVKLGSGHASADDQAAFNDWLTADIRHRTAWQEVCGMLQEPLTIINQAEQVQPGQRRAALLALIADKPLLRRRRKVLGGGAAILLLGATGAVWHRQQSLFTLFADVHTATAERQTVQLEDGSTLILNARSAVDVRFTAGLRLVRLIEGDIVAKVAPDADRAFVVQTREGDIRALGTQFMVSQKKDHSLVSVLEHRVLVRHASESQLVLEEGGVARLDTRGVTALAQENAMAHAAWMRGVLDVRDQSLAEVIDALRPYWRGYLRVSPEAARLRVFGVFQLDEPQAALHALVETQPIVMRQFGSLLVSIDLRE